MEAVVGVLLGCVVLLVLCVIGLVVVCSREQMRTHAQSKACDEVFMANFEKLTSRLVAICFPSSHVTYRQTAGPQLDGAQRDVRPHYLRNGKDATAKVEDAQRELAVVRGQVKDAEAQLRSVNAARATTREIAHPMDFETDEPGVTPQNGAQR